MKRAFFITLGIYLSLFAIINAIDFTVKPKKTLSLQHIKIKKCSCTKCTCKKCPEHPKKPPPPEPKKEIVQWEPKKAPVKELEKPKKRVKRKKVVRKKVKKVAKKPKKSLKVVKKQPQKSVKKIVKKAASKPIVANQKPQPTPCKECVKSSKEVPKPPKPSYQKQYLQSYAAKIKEAILRHLYYPRIARKTKKQGVVVIRFDLLPSKRVQNITILQSSGHKILDKAAKKTIKEASKEFPVPTEKITIQIPIEYKLR